MSENQKSVGLSIALPNGSLEEGTLRLFEEANLKIWKDPRRHDAFVDSPLISRATFMRPQHIPRLVEQGTYDIGICGWDCVIEHNPSEVRVVRITELLFGRGDSNGKARVVLVTSKSNSDVNTLLDLNRQPQPVDVLTEYPKITEFQLASHGIKTRTHFSYGGTEAHISSDYRYGVCLTDTGASLEANDLKIIGVLLETSTFLIANPIAVKKFSREITAIKHLLVGTLEARSFVFLTMHVSLAKKQAVLRTLPALKAPTITRLASGRQFSLGTAVSKSQQNDVIVNILQAGATDVLVQPILQMVRSW